MNRHLRRSRLLRRFIADASHELRTPLTSLRGYADLFRYAAANEPGEREKPVGRDGGYLWRLNTYWRFLERDGGTYIQCESVTLTRDVPFGFGWLIGPFVNSIPRESLTFTMERTRAALNPRS